MFRSNQSFGEGQASFTYHNSTPGGVQHMDDRMTVVWSNFDSSVLPNNKMKSSEGQHGQNAGAKIILPCENNI